MRDRARQAVKVLGGTAGLGLAAYVSVPKLLHQLGWHPDYDGRRFNLVGKDALVVTTSHDTLGPTGDDTGVWASEMTIPYYEFHDANLDVDVASVDGGEIPVDPQSLKWPLETAADDRFQADDVLQRKVDQSSAVGDVDFTDYDLVYVAGGWGAAYDLGPSEALSHGLSRAYEEGAILGSVCHGALGFLGATDEEGFPLVADRRVTAVTDKQVEELGITHTPQHPETEMRKAGAIFESETAFRDMFANHTVVDGRLVTGQNQNAGAEVAQKMLRLLANGRGADDAE